MAVLGNICVRPIQAGKNTELPVTKCTFRFFCVLFGKHDSVMVFIIQFSTPTETLGTILIQVPNHEAYTLTY